MENLGKHLQGGLTFTENDVASHATDIFRPIAQEVSMTGSQIIHYSPTTFNQTGPYDFTVLQKGNQYIQMNQIRLYMRAKVVTENLGLITDEDAVGICNLFGNSIFQTIDIEINGKQISDLQNTHSNYKAYLETLLSYSPNGYRGHLAASGWALDEAEHFEETKYGAGVDGADDENTQNNGLRARRALIKGSRTFDLMFPLHCDFLNCDRLLPPGISFTLKLTRTRDSFVLMQHTNAKTFKVIIGSLRLSVPYISVSNEIVKNHMEKIASQPIMLPIQKTEITAHHFAAGLSNVTLPNQFQNKLPKTLLIGMLSTASYNGTATTNPYNFRHFDVNHVCISRCGVQIPSEAYMPDWDNNLFMREYRSFFDNTGVGTDNISSQINTVLYKSGATLFAFDLTPDKCNGYHWHRREAGGQIDVDLRFKNPLPAGGMTLMLFGVFDALVTIDKADNVMVNF